MDEIVEAAQWVSDLELLLQASINETYDFRLLNNDEKAISKKKRCKITLSLSS